MKKFAGIMVATVLAFSLVACGPVDSAVQNLAGAASNKGSGVVTADDDGYAEGRIGDVMRTYFFDYTVNSAYTCKEFEGYTPAEGNKLLVAELTVKNTDRSTVTMYDTDFQIQWGDDDDDDAFDAPITYYSDAVSDDQLPEEYDLSVNEERTGLLVFEVPEDSKDLFLRSSFGLAVQSLNIQYIDTADNGLYFLFHGNTFEDLLITDQGYDLRANLCLDDGKLGTTHHLWCLIDHHLGKTGIFHFHAFLIDDQHGYGLLVGI